MTTFVATSRSADAPNIEPGIYDGKFVGVTKKYIEGGQYGAGDRFEWTFALLDDEGDELYENGDPLEVSGLTSLSTNVLSKTEPRAVRYLKALMSKDEFEAFKAGEGIDAEALTGRVAQVDVMIKDNGWPSIANVLPPRKRRSSRKSSDDAE